MSASESESSAAPPIPCTTRPAISIPSESALPETTEPTAKATMPITKTSRRPRMSPSRPAVITVAVSASR